jgi:nucleoside-triphosphatase THEP1
MLPKICIITGGKGSGKTSFCKTLLETLETHGVLAGGILSPRVINGYDVVDINRRTAYPLCRTDGNSEIVIGKYHFSGAAIEAGNKAIARSLCRNTVTIIDEVGPLELEGGGWFPSITLFENTIQKASIIVCRQYLISTMVKSFNIHNYETINVELVNPDDIAAHL